MRTVQRVAVVVLLGILAIVRPHAARAIPDFSCDDEHGLGTTLLCEHDHLLPGAYIKSPSEQYRMYMGSGNVVVLDMTDYDNPVFQYLVYDDAWNGAGAELDFDYDFMGQGMLIFDSSSPRQLIYFEEGLGVRSLRIANNGCVGLYYENGSLAWNVAGAVNWGCDDPKPTHHH